MTWDLGAWSREGRTGDSRLAATASPIWGIDTGRPRGYTPTAFGAGHLAETAKPGAGEGRCTRFGWQAT